MSVLPLITMPDPMLRQRSLAVEQIDLRIKRLVTDMFDTMYHSGGAGLAAIQLGIARRIVVIDLSPDPSAQKAPLVFVNPEIVSMSIERSTFREGCLSIPGYMSEVERPAEIEVSFLAMTGEEQRLAADGLLAVCLQHEIDHLDGILFIDYLTSAQLKEMWQAPIEMRRSARR